MLEPQFYAGFVTGFTAATFLGILFDFLIRRRNRAQERLRSEVIQKYHARKIPENT